MQILNPSLDLREFFARLRAARERVLFVDCDGTLAPFTERPERTRPYPGVVPLLDVIGRDAGRLGICATDEDLRLLEEGAGDGDALRRRGIGVLVRAAPRATRADLWLEPPGDLVEFLSRWRASAAAR